VSEEEPDAGGPGVPPVAELSYAEASGELDVIIRELDQGLVDVDLLEARFRRAIDIVEELDRRIRGARERVDALMPRLDAVTAEGADPADEA
jgi:exonuclease VII small subunit